MTATDGSSSRRDRVWRNLAAAGGWVSSLDGSLLADAAWKPRHYVVTGLITINALVIVPFALAADHGDDLLPSLIALSVGLTLAWAPSSRRRPREVAVAVSMFIVAAIQNRYVGNFSSLTAAYILLLAIYQDWLPLVVGVGLSLILPILAFTSPDTLDAWKSFRRETAETGAFLRFGGVLVAAGAAVLVWRANGVASRDRLTGLPSRARVERRLGQALHAGRRPAVLVCDVDAFRLAADELPPSASDGLIRETGRRLRRALSPATETVAAGSGARYIVTRLRDTDAADATELARRLCAVVADEPFVLAEGAIPLSISVGIALGEPGDEPSDLISAAGIAARKAKWGGDAAIAIAEHESVGAGVRPDGPITAELRRALEDDELVMYYQPLVNLHSGDIVGAEALVRWQHPTRGLLTPGSFLRYGESHPWLNAAIGRAIAAMVLEQTAVWTRELPASLPEGVAVNVAPTRLKDPSLRDEVRDMLAAAGLDPARITLELTEGALMDLDIDVPAILAELSTLGVRIALDDFGTGHSSLAHLRDFPLHEIKVDRSFIARITDSAPDRAVVRAVLAIANEFGATVVIEGVESEAQREALLGMASEDVIAQGYLFGRPMPVDAMTSLLRTAEPLPATGVR